MNQIATRTIPVKIYLDADAYLAFKSKCEVDGLSMSTAGSLAFRQWQPAHRTRRVGRDDMPRPGPRRPRAGFPSRAGGAPVPHLRV